MGDVERQLDPAVGGVDGLAAGTRGPGEPFAELAGRDHQPVVHAKVFGHSLSLTHAVERSGRLGRRSRAVCGRIVTWGRNRAAWSRRPSGMRTKRAVPARSSRSSCSSFSARAASFSARVPRRRLLAVAAVPSVILIAAVAGCSGTSSSSSAAEFGAAAAAPSAAGAAAGGAAAGSSSSSSVKNGLAASGAAGSRSGVAAKYVPAGQRLIYTAQLTVRAANVSSAISRATSIVSAAGGYVSTENASSGQGKPSQASATVTFKIPVAAYDTTLAALSGGGLGTQLSLSQQAQDVTQQVADVGSRVASDQAAIAQLRSLLKHAGDVSSLLSVQNQINSQESDLESMLAQQNALNH